VGERRDVWSRGAVEHADLVPVENGAIVATLVVVTYVEIIGKGPPFRSRQRSGADVRDYLSLVIVYSNAILV
jgi:hypothetical protein